MRLVAYSLVLAAGMLAAGCASTSSVSHAEAPADDRFAEQTGFDHPWYARKRYGNDGMGVAAAREPDYIHVLTRDRRMIDGSWPDMRPSPVESAHRADGAAQVVVPPDLPAAGALARNNFDNRLRRAWRRFCDGGIEMTADDWNAIAEAGGLSAMPAEFEADCRPPK